LASALGIEAEGNLYVGGGEGTTRMILRVDPDTGEVTKTGICGLRSCGRSAAEVLAGDRAEWRLREALVILEGGGLETDAARARHLPGSLGAPVPRARRKVPGLSEMLSDRGATAQEAEVLGLVAERMTDPGIARRLYLSPRTVQTYVASLLGKLGVPTPVSARSAWV
jgi:DNA-binding CsgD family transcriptional regulator